MVHRELEQLGGTLHVPQSNQVLRKKSRYKGKALSKVLPDVLKAMSAEETGFLCIQTGKRGYTVQVGTSKEVVPGRQTTLRAGSKLLTRIQRFGISFADIRRSNAEEVIQLREKKPRNDKSGALLEYEDTEETEAFRASLRSINNRLEQADIECIFATTEDRRLKRIFNNGDFQQGGRLNGGFWQKMGASDRLSSIIIDDDSVVELDYGQMGLMLLYGLAEATPPEGDLYDLSAYGIPTSCRSGIKKVIQAAINSKKPLKKMPHGARKSFPNGITVGDVLKAVSQRHPEVYPYFNAGIGMKIMRLESDILVDVLLSLKAKGITALPIHDAILVNANYEAAAREVMREEFRRKVGLFPEISTEHP